MLAPWKKNSGQPRQHIKNRDITLPTKVHLVKAMVFPRHVWMWELDYKESWASKNWCFELCWRRLLKVPWIARRSNQSTLKEISPETPILWSLDVKNWLIGKVPDAGKDWRQEKKGTTEDEMVGWHHWLDGHEFEQAPGVGDGQASLACWRPWGHRVGHNWVTKLNWRC